MFLRTQANRNIGRICPIESSYTSVSTVRNAPTRCPRVSVMNTRRSHSEPLLLSAVATSMAGIIGDDHDNVEQCWDVVGFGQAMVDCSATVDERVLQLCGVAKGDRRVISISERTHLLELLDKNNLEVSTGGSLANTLVGLGRLSATPSLTHRKLRVGMAGSIGTDTPGQYFQSHLQQAGVGFIPDQPHPTPSSHPLAPQPSSPAKPSSIIHARPAAPYNPAHSTPSAPPSSCMPPPASETGTVMVLTTPDAQRSFLSFFPADTARITPPLLRAVSTARALVIEGYMWELPGATAAIHGLIKHAREHGTLVVLTAGDKDVVERNRERILEVMCLGVDVLFANALEATALLGSPVVDAVDAATKLGGLCQIAIVTDGSRGSCIAALGELHVTPPCWSVLPPVDTCGAGDAFAAGALFALLSGCCMATVGQAGARLAASVIARRGAQVLAEDAEDLGRMLQPKQSGSGHWQRQGRRVGVAGVGAAAAFMRAAPTAVSWAR